MDETQPLQNRAAHPQIAEAHRISVSLIVGEQAMSYPLERVFTENYNPFSFNNPSLSLCSIYTRMSLMTKVDETQPRCSSSSSSFMSLSLIHPTGEAHLNCSVARHLSHPHCSPSTR